MLSLAIATGCVGLVLVNPLFIFISVFFSSILFLGFATVSERLEIHRHILNPNIFEEDTVSIRLEVINKHFAPGYVEIFDKLPRSVKIVRGINKATMKMARGDKGTINYSVECPLRGFYNIGPLYLRCRDMFGLFNKERKLDLITSLTVYPRIQELKSFNIKTRYKKINPGAVMLRTIGQGTDFHSIREYVHTDPFSRINWKATARKRELMVNQYELEDVYDLTIFIDSRYVTKIGTPIQNALEYSIKAAASIARSAIRRTNRVGIVTYGKEVDIIPPGNSNTQMKSILTSLTATYAGGRKTFKDALDMATPYLTPKSPVIILSPLQQDDTLEDAIQMLVSKKYQITVVSPSIVDFERLVTGIYSPKYLLVKMERQNRLAEIKSLGVKVVDWVPEKSVRNVIMEVAY